MGRDETDDGMHRLQAAHQDRLKALREKLRQERENLRRYHQDAVSSQECQVGIHTFHVCNGRESVRPTFMTNFYAYACRGDWINKSGKCICIRK